MRDRRRTLRSALTRWLMFACAFGLLVLGTGLVLSRRASFRAGQDAALLAGADEVIARLAQEDVAGLAGERLGTLLPAGSENGFCALRSEDGALLAAWNVSGAQRLPPVASFGPLESLQAAFVTLPGTDSTFPGAEGRARVPVRVVTLPFRNREHLYYLQLAVPERPWSAALGELVLPALCGVLALGLVAPFVARMIVRGVLAPLRGLSEAARSLSPSNLGERFHVQAADVELRRLEAELNAALERVEEGYRAQAHFASNVAHELKSPIAALVTDAQVSRLSSRDPEKVQAFMKRTEEELKHLGELVESLLVMARVDTHQSRSDLVYVDDIARRAVSHSAALAEQAGVRLRLDLAEPTDECDPFVRGDAQLLQAMVENLLRNAISHSPRGTEVRLERSCNADTVLVGVHDQGPGIDEELRELVFVRGLRRANQRNDAGAGLGLAIVSDIAQLHRGSVSVGRNESGGCSIFVSLPMEARQRMSARREQHG